MLRAISAAALAFALVLPAGPAAADMSLKQFRDYAAMPGGGPLVRSYLSGLRDGIVKFQEMRESQDGLAPSFCPDGDELMHGTRFEEVLQDRIQNPPSGEPWPEDIQMSRLVILAMQDAFPCESY